MNQTGSRRSHRAKELFIHTCLKNCSDWKKRLASLISVGFGRNMTSSFKLLNDIIRFAMFLYQRVIFWSPALSKRLLRAA